MDKDYRILLKHDEEVEKNMQHMLKRCRQRYGPSQEEVPMLEVGLKIETERKRKERVTQGFSDRGGNRDFFAIQGVHRGCCAAHSSGVRSRTDRGAECEDLFLRSRRKSRITEQRAKSQVPPTMEEIAEVIQALPLGHFKTESRSDHGHGGVPSVRRSQRHNRATAFRALKCFDRVPSQDTLMKVTSF